MSARAQHILPPFACVIGINTALDQQRLAECRQNDAALILVLMPVPERTAVHAQPKRVAVPTAPHEKLPGVGKEMGSLRRRFAFAGGRPAKFGPLRKELRGLLHITSATA